MLHMCWVLGFAVGITCTAREREAVGERHDSARPQFSASAHMYLCVHRCDVFRPLSIQGSELMLSGSSALPVVVFRHCAS
ncbi:hypothetical protein COO60DRAFT_1529159, partial [Scenedesmus sp. NREL 46B-D3]